MLHRLRPYISASYIERQKHRFDTSQRRAIQFAFGVIVLALYLGDRLLRYGYY